MEKTISGMSAGKIQVGMIIRSRCNCYHEVLEVERSLDSPRAIVAFTLPHGQQDFFRATDWVEVLDKSN